MWGRLLCGFCCNRCPMSGLALSCVPRSSVREYMFGPVVVFGQCVVRQSQEWVGYQSTFQCHQGKVEYDTVWPSNDSFSNYSNSNYILIFSMAIISKKNCCYSFQIFWLILLAFGSRLTLFYINYYKEAVMQYISIQ